MTTNADQVPTRKLIEVSLPLEAINREPAREKSVPRRGHPATMHLWWTSCPLAAGAGGAVRSARGRPVVTPGPVPPRGRSARRA